MFGFVKNNREMGRLDPRRAIAHELEKLGAEESHRSGRQTVGAVIIFRELVDRLEIRAKDERRSVNQENMVARLDWAVYRGHMFNRRHRHGAFSAINGGSSSDATALAGEEPLKSAPRCSISMQPMIAPVRYMI
jgi:hypothetical protein